MRDPRAEDPADIVLAWEAVEELLAVVPDGPVKDVLRLVAAGLPAEEIAERLCLAPAEVAVLTARGRIRVLTAAVAVGAERLSVSDGRAGTVRQVPAAAVDEFAEHDFAYLTTTGRRTGRAHEVEMWFGYRDGVVYLLSGAADAADWVRNLRSDPAVSLRIGGRVWPARARLVDDPGEDALARRLLTAKYQGWLEGTPMSEWGRTALAVAVEPSV